MSVAENSGAGGRADVFSHVRSIEVSIWGRHVGTIVPARDGISAFIYDRDFIRSGIEISPLGMPLSDRVYEFRTLPVEYFHGLPPAIADSLPDSFGNALVDRWMADRGVAKGEVTALDRLAYVGSRGPGALTFAPSRGPGRIRNSAVEMRLLVEQARNVLNRRLEDISTSEQLNEIIRLGSSLGGAQAKAVVGWNECDNSFRYGTLDLPPEYGQWIVKFTPDGHPDRGRGEFMMYELAKACGIDMMESRLIEADGMLHFMTRRFDRQGGARQHVQTFSAMCHLFPGSGGEATASYEQLFMAARQLGLGYQTLEQLFRRMAFNVEVGEYDDHVKNFAFLLREGGSWELAPAYDITGSRHYGADDAWGDFPHIHALSVNGRQHGITDGDLLAVADRFGIGNAKDILGEIRSRCSNFAGGTPK